MTQPALATTTSTGRTYAIAGRIFPSVTSILGILPKVGIYKAREKSIAVAALGQTAHAIAANEGDDAALSWLLEQANVRRDEAGTRGSDIHAAIDQRIENAGWATEYERFEKHGDEFISRTFTHESIGGYLASFDAFLKDHEPKFLLHEATVYHSLHGYAGTLDAMLEIDGVCYVADWKSGWVGEPSAWQLAAYANAQYVARTGLGLSVYGYPMGAFVLDLKEDGYKIVMVKDLVQSWHDFLAIRAAYDVARRKKSEVLERPAKRVA